LIRLLRGVRGATTAEDNKAAEIIKKVEELLKVLVELNNIQIDDIGAVIFSSTPDLNTAFPAAGARAIGWSDVPLFGTQEIDNPAGPPFCIRVLILWNTDKAKDEIKHVYLHGASVLRQDIPQQ
jgi:chorismate mutase